MLIDLQVEQINPTDKSDGIIQCIRVKKQGLFKSHFKELYIKIEKPVKPVFLF